VGGQDVIDHVQRSYGYTDYLAVYGGLLILGAALHWRRAGAWLSANPLLFLFFVSYFVVYTLLYFWYAPIAAGDRLILAQFIPLLLVLASGVQSLFRGDRFQVRGKSIAWLTVLNLAILGMVVADSLWALQRGVYLLRGGG
jgi:hypothetical protein